MGNGGLLIAATFLITLFLSTSLIAYFDEGFNGSTQIIIIKLPMDSIGFNIETNFKNSCNLSAYETIGTWSCGTNGISTSSGELRVPLTLKSQDGIYDNEYHITSHGEFSILVADTKFGNKIRLNVKPDGIYIPDYIMLPIGGSMEWGTKKFIPLDGTIQDLIIKTHYDINNNQLTINYNGASYFLQGDTIPVLGTGDLPYIYLTEVKWTAGLISDSSLTMESLTTQYQPRSSEVGSALDGLALAINLAYAMGRLATYTFPYTVIPLQLQLWLIAPQELLILVGVAMFIRGD